jgi:hypothetical protein
MMFLLLFNVSYELVFLSVRNCKTAVSLRPSCKLWKKIRFLDPNARKHFDVLDHIGYTMARMNV